MPVAVPVADPEERVRHLGHVAGDEAAIAAGSDLGIEAADAALGVGVNAGVGIAAVDAHDQRAAAVALAHRRVDGDHPHPRIDVGERREDAGPDPLQLRRGRAHRVEVAPAGGEAVVVVRERGDAVPQVRVRGPSERQRSDGGDRLRELEQGDVRAHRVDVAVILGWRIRRTTGGHAAPAAVDVADAHRHVARAGLVRAVGGGQHVVGGDQRARAARRLLAVVYLRHEREVARGRGTAVDDRVGRRNGDGGRRECERGDQ